MASATHRTRPVTAALCVALGLSCGRPEDAPPSASGPAPAPPPAGPVAPAPPPPAPLSAAERAAPPGRILFLAERPGAGGASIDQILPSGQGQKTLLQGPPAGEGPGVFPGPVAPDGVALAVITAEDRDGVHLERLEVRPLREGGELGEPVWRSDPASQVRSPNWSPDGRALAFEAAFTSFRDIYRLDLLPETAPTLRRLTDHPAGNYEPAFSPDGRRIAFVSSRDDNAEVYVMRADGGEQTRVTQFHRDDWGPVWAPDGATLAFLSNREGVDRIFLCRPDGTELRRLTPASSDISPPPQDFEPAEAEPTFSPDGRALVFSVRTAPQQAALRRVDLTSGALTDLTPGAASDREPVFSPDGALLVFASDRDGDPELYLMRPDGTGVTRLTERRGADWLPRWSPR